MNSEQFMRRIRRLGRERGIDVRFDRKRGKGSHGTLHYGTRRTTVPHRRNDLRRGTLRSMLDNLGLTEDDLR